MNTAKGPRSSLEAGESFLRLGPPTPQYLQGARDLTRDMYVRPSSKHLPASVSPAVGESAFTQDSV